MPAMTPNSIGHHLISAFVDKSCLNIIRVPVIAQLNVDGRLLTTQIDLSAVIINNIGRPAAYVPVCTREQRAARRIGAHILI